MGIFTKAVAEGERLLDYIPQRAPVVMVDKFFGVDGNLSASGMTVREGNIFSRGGELGECGIIEHMAQSAAVRIGYVCKQRGEKVPLGFIGSVCKVLIHALPRTGDELRTEITIDKEFANISLLSAVTRSGGVTIAECQMKVVTQ